MKKLFYLQVYSVRKLYILVSKNYAVHGDFDA